MKASRCPKRWEKSYNKLQPHIREIVDRKLEFFDKDNRHSSLRIAEVANNLYRIWINTNFRVLGYKDANEMVWFWTGPHGEYEKIKKQWRSKRHSLA